jgi:hypothetical protein
VTFTLQHDIDSMEGHQGYVLVDEEVTIESVESDTRTDTAFAPVIKRMGRPRKVANV